MLETSLHQNFPRLRKHSRRSFMPGGTYLRATGILLMAAAIAAGCKRAPGPDVVATVNGHPIYRAELEKNYESNLGNNPQRPTAEQADATRLGILRQMIDDEILQERAAKLHLVASDEEVEAKLTEFKAPFTEEEFNKRLKMSGMSLDDLRRELRRNLTAEKLLNKEVVSRINITDSDIVSYYNANKAQFDFIEPKYNVAEIVVTNQPLKTQQGLNLQNSKAANDAEARRKIDALHNHLQNGEDFGTLAQNYSENPNDSSNGGDMGFISESNLRSNPAVFNAISKLQPGQFTDVIPLVQQGSKTPAGYAIYKLLEKEPAGQRQLNDPRVQQDIRQQLRDSRGQLLREAYYEVLHNQAHIENYFAQQIFRNGAQ